MCFPLNSSYAKEFHANCIFRNVYLSNLVHVEKNSFHFDEKTITFVGDDVSGLLLSPRTGGALVWVLSLSFLSLSCYERIIIMDSGKQNGVTLLFNSKVVFQVYHRLASCCVPGTQSVLIVLAIWKKGRLAVE